MEVFFLRDFLHQPSSQMEDWWNLEEKGRRQKAGIDSCDHLICGLICSKIVTGRRPLQMDPELDYTVDSGEEWEVRSAEGYRGHWGGYQGYECYQSCQVLLYVWELFASVGKGAWWEKKHVRTSLCEGPT